MGGPSPQIDCQAIETGTAESFQKAMDDTSGSGSIMEVLQRIETMQKELSAKMDTMAKSSKSGDFSKAVYHPDASHHDIGPTMDAPANGATSETDDAQQKAAGESVGAQKRLRKAHTWAEDEAEFSKSKS